MNSAIYRYSAEAHMTILPATCS